jgi:uncharacterized protein
MAFFHGIEVTEVSTGGVTVQVVNSAVIGLIGSAAQWSAAAGVGPGINKPTLITSQSAASTFGQPIQGYTIPEALADMQLQGAGSIIVIDVFNPLIHQTLVNSLSVTAPSSNSVPISLGRMGLVGPGLPNAPLTTASADSVAQMGNGYAPADTITLAGGIFSVAAVLTVQSTQLANLSVNAAGTGYDPGDEITLAGGTSSITAQLSVATTKVVSATVAVGGSGGTNGTQTVTGTTGTGQKFTASVTVSGGAITAVLSITSGGAYTANPVNLAAEPVTGASLTGAELDVVMGINTVAIVNRGSYTANTATFTQASTTGSGTGATFNSATFGVLTASVTTTGTYSTVPSNPVSQGSTSGSGAGAQFNITFAGPASTVVIKNSAGSTTYVENTDYTIDYVNGLLYTKSGGAITAGQALKASYAYCDPSKVADTDIIGSVTAGIYTGIQALQTTFQSMGIFAKLLVTPSFTDATVATALLAMANTIRAIAFVDSPPQTSVSVAIANRGNAGNAFNLASDRLVLCFPQQFKQASSILPTGVMISAQGVITYTYASGTVESPYSQWVVGATAAKDLANGYWYSPSNTSFLGTVGPDVTLYMSAFDPNSDTNNLNANGILTVFNAFGSGFRVWGNRASSFPASGTPTTFIAIRRTLDVVEQSIQVSMLPYLDQPITNGLINNVLASCNAFLNSLIQKGALITGSQVTYNPADNPASQLAAGQLVFRVSVMPPPPAELIVFNVYINTSLLSNIGPTVTSASSQTAVLPTA